MIDEQDVVGAVGAAEVRGAGEQHLRACPRAGRSRTRPARARGPRARSAAPSGSSARGAGTRSPTARRGSARRCRRVGSFAAVEREQEPREAEQDHQLARAVLRPDPPRVAARCAMKLQPTSGPNTAHTTAGSRWSLASATKHRRARPRRGPRRRSRSAPGQRGAARVRFRWSSLGQCGPRSRGTPCAVCEHTFDDLIRLPLRSVPARARHREPHLVRAAAAELPADRGRRGGGDAAGHPARRARPVRARGGPLARPAVPRAHATSTSTELSQAAAALEALPDQPGVGAPAARGGLPPRRPGAGGRRVGRSAGACAGAERR